MIRFNNVCFAPAGKPVFSGFSLDVKPGEKVVVKGPSGVGKTTLLRMLLGVTAPDAGGVTIAGRAVDAHNCWELRRRMAYAPQELALLERTGRDFLGYAFSLRANREPGLDPDRLAGLLQYFGLSDSHLDSLLGDLSGGERQRLDLIAAILLDRDILLLDEPTASLDPAMKDKVVAWVLCECDKTVLVISHDDVWSRHCDQGLRVVEFGGGS